MPTILEERNLKFEFLHVEYLLFAQHEDCPPFDFESERKIVHTTLWEIDWVCQQYQKPRYKTLRESDFPPPIGMNPHIGVNIVFTVKHEYIGWGTGGGGTGGAKVFWLPYSVKWLPEDTQARLEKHRYLDEPGIEFDPINILCHEVHHAIGGHHSHKGPVIPSFLELVATWNAQVANFGKVLTPRQILEELIHCAKKVPKRTRLALELMKNLGDYQDYQSYRWIIAWLEYREKGR
jgi:hypothetical protein